MTETVLMLLRQLRNARRSSQDTKVHIAAELLGETGMIPNTPNAIRAWIDGRDPGDLTSAFDSARRRHDNV
jgi:hypothetical protein